MTEQEHGLALQAGTLLHEFRIEKILGEGGFGLTYLAFDTDLEKYVAIKEYLPIDFAIRKTDKTVIPRTETTKEDFNWGLQAFINEARILAKFDHPNIVRINRFFQLQGTAYIAMEYVQGRTLTETIKDLDKLTEVEMLSLLEPLIDGLKQVHQQNYYHRDIKPDNIILRDNGTPVLIDFGAARLAIGGKSRSVTTIVTPGYAPIEQYSSKGKFGAWTDVYALAAVAYTCLTGERPDDASDRVVDDEVIPTVQAARKQGRVAFLTAIDKGLAIRANDRPQTLDAWWTLLSQENEPKKAVLPTKVIKPDVKAKAVKTIKSVKQRDNKKEVVVISRARTAFRAVGTLLIFVMLGAMGLAVYEDYVKRGQELQARQEKIARQEKLDQQAEIARQEKIAKQVKRNKAKKLAKMHPKMISIPAGQFRMGDLSGAGDGSEKPVHTVNIGAFQLSQTEVTFAQYDAYAEAVGVIKPRDNGWGRGNRPVVNVSWKDAIAYAEWLSQQTGQHFRLPSESEWEYAARAGSSTKYSWGDSIGVNKANCDGCGSAWDDKKTAPVASFQANDFGLYDMHGNVWEWVQDCWQGNYDNYSSNNHAISGYGCSRRVIRGGSWSNKPRNIRSATRGGNPATNRYDSIGFRLAQD